LIRSDLKQVFAIALGLTPRLTQHIVFKALYACTALEDDFGIEVVPIAFLLMDVEVHGFHDVISDDTDGRPQLRANVVDDGIEQCKQVQFMGRDRSVKDPAEVLVEVEEANLTHCGPRFL